MITTKGASLFITCSAALLLAGCAGGFGTDLLRTRISTVNTTAKCSLTGQGYTYAIQTPAHVVLPKQAAPITLSCQAPGYRTFVTTLKPLFDVKFVANFAAGSAMGLFIDMVNGQHEKYPARVRIHMEPTTFSTARDRDSWFDRYRVHIARKWGRIVGEAEHVCDGEVGEGGDCESGIRALKADRNRELGLLEARRRNARIRSQSTAEGLPPLG